MLRNRETIETNFENLVSTLTEQAISFVGDEREANRLVSYMLTDLLYNTRVIASDF